MFLLFTLSACWVFRLYAKNTTSLCFFYMPKIVHPFRIYVWHWVGDSIIRQLFFYICVCTYMCLVLSGHFVLMQTNVHSLVSISLAHRSVWPIWQKLLHSSRMHVWRIKCDCFLYMPINNSFIS